MNKTDKLLANRGKEYGNAWMLVGLVMGLLEKPFSAFLVKAPEFSHAWVQMLSKLIRILFSPYKQDHYEDIIGYATLCLKHLKEGNNESTPK